MSDTVVIDGEFNLLSMIDGDISAAVPADGLEFESGIYTPSGYIITAEVAFKLPHEKPPAVVVFCDSTGEKRSASANLLWTFVDFAKLTSAPIVATESLSNYAYINSAYKSTASTVDWIRTTISSADYSNVTAEGFSASIEPNGITTRWQNGIPYKWIAIWKE